MARPSRKGKDGMTTPGSMFRKKPTAEELIKQADPFRLPKGYRWADERDEEEITPQDGTRKDAAEAKRARKLAARGSHS
jgi:hypothetical protein